MGVNGRRKSTFTTAPVAGWWTMSRRGRSWTEWFGFTRKIYDGDAEPRGQSVGRKATEQSGRCRLLCAPPRPIPRKGAFMSPSDPVLGARFIARAARYVTSSSSRETWVWPSHTREKRRNDKRRIAHVYAEATRIDRYVRCFSWIRKDATVRGNGGVCGFPLRVYNIYNQSCPELMSRGAISTLINARSYHH